jgi:hypothetical protein
MADVLEKAKGTPVDPLLGNRLIGDLHSTPDPMRRLVDQDVYAMEWARKHAPTSEFSWMDQMIKDRQEQLRSELANADIILDALIRTKVNHQMRSRPDYATGKLAIEQWIPAMRCWLVNGLFDANTPTWEIVRALEAGDPTKKTAEEKLAEDREKATSIRAANEAAGDQKVKDVVAGLGDKRINQFIEVERAIQTGETITVREGDRRVIEKLVDGTKEAANRGDIESQQVLSRGGQFDNRACILPTTNPLRHRHRKELTGTHEKEA